MLFCCNIVIKVFNVKLFLVNRRRIFAYTKTLNDNMHFIRKYNILQPNSSYKRENENYPSRLSCHEIYSFTFTCHHTIEVYITYHISVEYHNYILTWKYNIVLCMSRISSFYCSPWILFRDLHKKLICSWRRNFTLYIQHKFH